MLSKRDERERKKKGHNARHVFLACVALEGGDESLCGAEASCALDSTFLSYKEIF